MATAQDFIDVLTKEIGYKEYGENQSKYGDWYGMNEEWCAMFISWGFNQIGMGSKMPRTASAGHFAKAARDSGMGTYHPKGSGYSPKMGDLFIEDYNGDDWAKHIGSIRSDAQGGKFMSIEGNYGHAVQSIQRNVCDYCYVTPPFDGISNGGRTPLKPQRETVINVPAGLGKTYTYETWNRTDHGYSEWSSGTNQKKLIETSKSRGEYSFDSDGYGYVGQRCVVAMTSTFGAVGDYVDIYCADGRVINAVIGDEKSQTYEAWDNNPANKWGHNNGECIVEFMTNWAATPVHQNPPSNGGIIKVINLGSYFEYPEYATGFDGGNISDTSGGVPITRTETISYVGEQVGLRENPFAGRRMANQDNIELYISNPATGKIMKPVVVNPVIWETRKWGYSQLSFDVVKDKYLDFQEGNQVIFKYNGQNVFCGYVFDKSRSDVTGAEDGVVISVMAADQLRYFENTDIYVYDNITASELLEGICRDHSVKTGTITDTVVKLPQTAEDNEPLIDIMERALTYTAGNGGIYYLMFDDFGSLMLMPQYWYRVPYALNNHVCEKVEYKSSINDGTFNRVKLYRDNDQTGVREVYINDKSAEYPEWGVLQYTAQLDEGVDGTQEAERIVKITANKTRSLSATKAFGDVRVKAGTCIYVDLNLGDIVQDGFMEVKSAKHSFTGDFYSMDLELIGGQFI